MLWPSLEYLYSEWSDIPSLAQEWPHLTKSERRDFIVEWPIKEDRLFQLRKYVSADLCTPAQRGRYEQLLALIARHRPLLEQLLED